MRTNWIKVMGAIAVVGLAVACGSKEAEKPAASAEPAAPAPPPPPATQAAPPPAQPGGEKGEKGEKGPKGEKGEKGEPGKHGAKEGGGEKAEKVIRLGRAHLEFNHPGAGWVEVKKGKWVIFHPADKSSILAYVEFERPNEATKRLQQIAERLELKDIHWKGAGVEKAVGPQHLKAHFAEGTCKVASNKHDCVIEYYTVEGALLIVYAFESDVKKAEKHERIATKSVETIRKI